MSEAAPPAIWADCDHGVVKGGWSLEKTFPEDTLFIRADLGPEWCPPAIKPKDGQRILIRFYIREGSVNQEYALSGRFEAPNRWLVKVPWETLINGKPVWHVVIPVGWRPLPAEPSGEEGDG